MVHASALIPTAAGNVIDPQKAAEALTKSLEMKRITVLHTTRRDEAESEKFVAPLKTARAVSFAGGRQWRLVDSYLGPRTQREVGDRRRHRDHRAR